MFKRTLNVHMSLIDGHRKLKQEENTYCSYLLDLLSLFRIGNGSPRESNIVNGRG